jgi:hypothetical protein
MAKTKFVLTASPTFKAKVGIPIPGGSPEIVEFTFRRIAPKKPTWNGPKIWRKKKTPI